MVEIQAAPNRLQEPRPVPDFGTRRGQILSVNQIEDTRDNAEHEQAQEAKRDCNNEDDFAYLAGAGGSGVVLLLSHIGGVLVVERRAEGVGKLVINNHNQIDQSADTAEAESAEPEDTGADFADIKTVRAQTAKEQAKEQRNRALFLERLRRSLHRGAGLCLGLISDIVDGAAAAIRTNQRLVGYLLTTFIAKHRKSSQQNQNNKLL